MGFGSCVNVPFCLYDCLSYFLERGPTLILKQNSYGFYCWKDSALKREAAGIFNYLRSTYKAYIRAQCSQLAPR